MAIAVPDPPQIPESRHTSDAKHGPYWRQVLGAIRQTGAGGAGSGTYVGGGGGRIGEGGSLAALMDELIEGSEARPLSSAGPASALIAEAVGRPEDRRSEDGRSEDGRSEYGRSEDGRSEDGESFLAGMFWWLFTHSSTYRRTARRLHASRRARPVVVCHGGGTRFNLLLLDPRRWSNEASVPLDRERMHASLVSSAMPWERLGSVIHRARLEDSIDSATVLASARELTTTAEFGVATVSSSDEMLTCAVSPAVALRSNDDRAIATFGSFLTDLSPPGDGTCLATCANHAVARRSRTVVIDGVELEVVRRHSKSDSCLIRVNKAVVDGRLRAGLNGPLRKTPRLNEPAKFDGAASGATQTTITGFDPAIVDPQPDELCRVYTEADTAKGDSGAALIDEDDFIVGFAWRRSSYQARAQFSSWVWAEQVYLAHRLFERSREL